MLRIAILVFSSSYIQSKPILSFLDLTKLRETLLAVTEDLDFKLIIFLYTFATHFSLSATSYGSSADTSLKYSLQLLAK